MTGGPPLLILGASGLLGRHVAAAATGRSMDIHVTAWTGDAPPLAGATVHRLDLRDLPKTRALLRQVRPSAVINCTGLVKSGCDDLVDAVILNAALPHLVAETIREWHGRLIHVSTDCVFSGLRGGYTETDIPDPVDHYGRTKLAGEATRPPALTVRTSFIGVEPPPSPGLLGWFLGQSGTVQGFRRAIWSGLTADVLARVLLDVVDRPELTGILHVGGDAVDKASLLRLVASAFGKSDVTIEAVDLPVCDRSLDAARMRSHGIAVPALAEMIAGYAAYARSETHVGDRS